MTAQTEIAHVVDYLVPEDETPECVEDCPACLAALPDEYEPADPDASAAVAPTGPYAARRIAEGIAATGAISYLVVDGEIERVR
jgi:hypothetical protein